MSHKPLLINGIEYDPNDIQCVHPDSAKTSDEETSSLSIVVFNRDKDGRPVELWPDYASRYRSERELFTAEKDVATNHRASRWEQKVCRDHSPTGLGEIHHEPGVQGITKCPDFGIGAYDDIKDCLTEGLLVECFVLQPGTQTSFRSHLGPGAEDKSWGGFGWRLYQRMLGKLSAYRGLPRGFRFVLAVDDMDSVGDDCLMEVLYGNRTPYLTIDATTGKVIGVGTRNLTRDPSYRQTGWTENLYPEGLFASFSDLLYGVIYRTMGTGVTLAQNPFQPMGLPQFRNLTTHEVPREAPSKAPRHVKLKGTWK